MSKDEQQKRGDLVPIGEALADLPGPVQALIPSRSTQHHFTQATSRLSSLPPVVFPELASRSRTGCNGVRRSDSGPLRFTPKPVRRC